MDEGLGRPVSQIDWKKVEDLLMAGCMGTGIAAYLGISAQTLYDRCFIEKGILFSQFSHEKKEKGDEILRAHQYAKALGLTDKGDNTLLIWLGKTRLKQIDASQLAASEAGKAQFNLVTNEKLRDGISTQELSSCNNKSSKSGNEEGGLGSSS